MLNKLRRMKIQYFILIGMSALIGWSFCKICNPPPCGSDLVFCGYKYLDYANVYLAIVILGLMFVVLPTGLSLCNNKHKSMGKIQQDNIGDFCIVCLEHLTIEQRWKGVCAEHDNPNLDDKIVQSQSEKDQ